MSGLCLQLKCHQIINEINDDNILPLVNQLGGIRALLIASLKNIASDNLVNILRNIRQNQDDSNDINNDDSIVLTSLPKEILLKTSEYLEISDIKQLTSTSIELALSLKSEINKIDIRIVTYDDLVLNDKLVFEQSQFDVFGKIYRALKGERLHDCIKHYNIISVTRPHSATFWNYISPNYVNLFPLYNIRAYHSGSLEFISSALNGNNLKFFVLDIGKSTEIIKGGGQSIVIKYFDIMDQKLYQMDIAKIDEYPSLTYNVLIKYIKNSLVDKYPSIFKPIHQNKDILNIPQIFRVYQQNGFKPTDIEEIMLNGKPLNRSVLIFELNMGNNDIISRFQNSIPIWKQELKKHGKPFCKNVKTFWSFHYGIYKTKKELNLEIN